MNNQHEPTNRQTTGIMPKSKQNIAPAKNIDAKKYPNGVFQSNGNLKMGDGERLSWTLFL